MKKTIYILLLSLLTAVPCIAQQQVLNHISNEYILEANELKAVTAVNQLKNTIYNKQFGESHPAQVEEINERTAYFKIFSKKNASSAEEGLLKVWHLKNAGSTTPIEEIVNSFYKILRIDDDPADYIIDYAKDSTIDGGFFFNKKHNGIYIYKITINKEFFICFCWNPSDTGTKNSLFEGFYIENEV